MIKICIKVSPLRGRACPAFKWRVWGEAVSHKVLLKRVEITYLIDIQYS
jgi:hypothetical protein